MAYAFHKEIPEGCEAFISITSGMSGFFAVHVWLNTEEKDLGPFWEPYDTGFGRYATKEKAIEEAMIWARGEDLPLVIP